MKASDGIQGSARKERLWPQLKRGLRWGLRSLRRLLELTRRSLRLCRKQIRGGGRVIKRGEVYYVPLWLPIALALLLASSVFWGDMAGLARGLAFTAGNHLRGPGQVELAGFFAPSVQYWSDEIGAWAAAADVDPHLLATVMQIESCGHPTVVSHAGAQGLFQVMPFHFDSGEDMLDPEANAARGSGYLHYCGGVAGGVIGLTLACYNGGPSVIGRERETWSAETRNYYRWGVGIYSDALAGSARSETMDQWIAAGGGRLCASAAAELRRQGSITPSS